MIRRSRFLSFTPLIVLCLACEARTTPTDVPVQLSLSGFDFVVESVTSLGTLGGDHANAFEVDNRGEVAAVISFGGVNTRPFHAVFWSEQTGAVQLGSLGGPDSETRALNNNGIVVGRSQKAGDHAFQHHPTLWKVGPAGVDIIELGPYAHGELNDVNDRGTAVGWFSAFSATLPLPPPTAFRWTENGGIVPLTPLGGNRSQAFAINESGDVAGSSTISATSPMHAVVWWADGHVTDIGTLGVNTNATAINKRGEVVGIGRTCGSCDFEAFYWSEEDGRIAIGPFGTRTFAFDIDNYGRVAGWYETSTGERYAFIWTRAAGKTNLPGLGGTFTTSGGFNARGQLSGRSADASGSIHAVLWQLRTRRTHEP